MAQQVIECHSAEGSPFECPAVIANAELVDPKKLATLSPFGYKKIEGRNNNKTNFKPTPYMQSVLQQPKVTPTIDDCEVKRRTGFLVLWV